MLSFIIILIFLILLLFLFYRLQPFTFYILLSF